MTISGWKGRRRGFSLVEILIVVVILGILAAIAIPKFASASSVSRENALKENLRLFRTQIGVYRVQHGDVFPGYPGDDSTQTATEAAFISQMTEYTDNSGNVSASQGAPYTNGPYWSQTPLNTVGNLSSVKMLAAGDTFTADGTTGWLYQPATGKVEPNQLGADSTGTNYTDY